MLGEHQEHEDSGPPPRRYRRLVWSAAAAACVAAIGAAAVVWQLRGEESAEDAGSTAPTETAEVTRTTLADTETWSGTVGRGEPVAIGATRQGTLTRTAEEGAEVAAGTELYRVDEEPVTAMIGTIPAYRQLAPGSSGPDVGQLESNLADMGYGGFTADDDYTYYTALAVQEWQHDIGVGVTGVVDPGQVVFLPDTGVVGASHADVGQALSPGSTVLEVVAGDPVVTVEADLGDHELLAADTEVTVEVSELGEVPGTVTDAAAGSAGGAEGSGDGGEGEEEDVLEVEVALEEDVPDSMIGASADVAVAVAEREDVLAAPVAALLALDGGGYGLEVVADDGSTSLIGVETGLFADGLVEVSGEGIDEGTVVGVASR